MDFDEYEYLEKTVEDQEHQKAYEDSLKKTERESRRRGRDDHGDADEDREETGKRSHKKHREEDPHRKDSDRSSHRSERDDRKLDRERGSREERERRHGERDSEKERGREHSSSRDREREKERIRERERRERDKDRERSRRSRSSSRKQYEELEGDRAMMDFEQRESRRSKEKKESEEPEADPERDQRTVFAYQMPLKASERDVYEFFSQAGKVRDVRLIMDRNARRSKGVGYIEFYDVMSVPMAIALSGHLLLGQPVMVKPSEAEKNLVQSTSVSGISGGAGLYGPVDRKLYVGNLHFNMTETQLRQIFEPFGTVEVVQLPLDLETGHCKGFGFVQFSSVEQAKAAQSLNGKLDIAGRTIKVSSVTDHVGMPDSGTKTADFDDDGGGLALNAHSRALLMQKLDRTGVASSIAGSLGVPVMNGSFPSQSGAIWPSNGQSVMPTAVPHGSMTMIPESPGNPSECLLLRNMFDPATEVEPDFDVDIKEDVELECSKFGRVMHAYVDKKSEGYVYMKFESTKACVLAQRAMHSRWFAGRMISAVFMEPRDYDSKFIPVHKEK